jgi:O-antigen ligase
MALAVALFGLAVGMGYAVAMGEVAAFYVALAVVGGIAVLFDWRIGAVLLIMLLPLGATHFVPHNVFGIPGLNPFNVVLGATLVSFVARERLTTLAPRQLVWLYVLPVFAAGLLGMSHAREIHPFFFSNMVLNFTDAGGYLREMALRPLLIVLAVVLVGAAAARAERPERLLIPMMAAVWMLALLQFGFIVAAGVRVGFLSSPQAREFYDSIGLHANDLGRLYAVAYGLFLFVWWETKRPALKTALFLSLGVAALAMVLTFSRGAFLGFFVINGLFLAWKFNARLIALALVAGAIVAALAPGYLLDRVMYGFATGDANTVSADRIHGIWLPLLPELWKSPIWGNGLGSTMWSMPMLTDEMNRVGHPHSAYLEALLDMGVIGLALMLAYFWHVWTGFRALGSNAYLSPEMRGFFQGASTALICFFITGWVGSSFRPEAEFCFLWLAIGMMYGMFRRTRAAAS